LGFNFVSATSEAVGDEENIKFDSLSKCFADRLSKQVRVKYIGITKEILNKTTLDNIFQYMKDMGDDLPYFLKEYL
jgi:hypothetical protein